MTLSPPSTSTLRRNALTATDVVAMATATYAPTAALYFNTPIAVSFAGSSVPFAFLLATVAMLIVASCMAQLAKHQATAGGYYSWIRSALGQRAGFIVGWLVLAGSFLTVPGVCAAEGDYVSTILGRYGVSLNWVVIALILLALVTVINIVGVRPSVRFGLVILAVELVIVTALCIVVVAKGGAAGNSIVPFKPPSGFGALGGAMVFGVLSFVGFEAVTTTGEEATRARRHIPLALFLAVIIGGGVPYVRFVRRDHRLRRPSLERPGRQRRAVRHARRAVREPRFPARDRHRRSDQLHRVAASDRAGRVAHLLRDVQGQAPAVGPEPGVRPVPDAGRGHRGEAALALVLFLVLGLWVGPENTYAYLGTVLVFAMVPVYVPIMVSTFVVFRTSLRRLFNPFLHVVLPLIGIAVVVYPLWSISPLGGPRRRPTTTFRWS